MARVFIDSEKGELSGNWRLDKKVRLCFFQCWNECGGLEINLGTWIKISWSAAEFRLCSPARTQMLFSGGAKMPSRHVLNTSLIFGEQPGGSNEPQQTNSRSAPSAEPPPSSLTLPSAVMHHLSRHLQPRWLYHTLCLRLCVAATESKPPLAGKCAKLLHSMKEFYPCRPQLYMKMFVM